MKLFLLLLIFGTAVQESIAQAFSLAFARSAEQADHISARYEHWTNAAFNLSAGCFFERNRKNAFNLSVYGAEALAEYASNSEGFDRSALGWRAGTGLSWQMEDEPWVYKEKPRSSVGFAGELTGEWFMTSDFALRVFVQQRFLFNPVIGRFRLIAGLRLAYSFSN